MTIVWKQRRFVRAIAFVVVTCLLMPFAAGCGSKNETAAPPPMATPGPIPSGPNNAMRPANAPQQGMSRGKKAVILLAGAALLYYLYKKHQAQQTATGTAAANSRPQLYRSSNGGIYYRDAQHNPIWVTAPASQMQVPADEVQQYAPDYNKYQGPAPAAPQGYRTQSFSQYDPSLMSGNGAPPGPGM